MALVNWVEYSRIIQMNGTRGMYAQVQKPFVTLLANGEHSDHHSHGGASASDFSWVKLPDVPKNTP